MAITYYNEDIDFKFKGKLITKRWIKTVAEAEGCVVGDIQVVFCSDKYILETNNNYLSHNYIQILLLLITVSKRAIKSY
ncbi:MAG: hypothetical protein R3Y26_02470 [Rikenellaceae bacterium]